MVVPVLIGLLKTYPELKITVVTKSFFVPIFKNLPKNVEIISAKTHTEHKGFLGLIKLGKSLKQNKIDQIADLHNVLRSKILRFYLSGIKTAIIDKGRKEKKALTRSKNKKFKALTSTPQRYVRVFEQLGYSFEIDETTHLDKLKLTTKIISLVGNSNLKLIGIAPYAAHDSKVYPEDLMEELIAKLDKTHQYKILLFGGGEKETAKLNKLALQYENLVSVAGKLTFEEEIKLISNLDLMVSMDSGNGHLAAMFGIPVITIWGSTHPYAGFAPFGQTSENQFIPDLEKYPLLPTSVFGNKEVSGYEGVMRTINPIDVIARIQEILP